MKQVLVGGFFPIGTTFRRSEVALALFLAHYFSEQRESFDFSRFSLKVEYFLIPLVLIFEEPDLGSSGFTGYLVRSVVCLWF